MIYSAIGYEIQLCLNQSTMNNNNGTKYRAWQINGVNDGLINLCKLGLGLMIKRKGPINLINLSLIHINLIIKDVLHR